MRIPLATRVVMLVAAMATPSSAQLPTPEPDVSLAPYLANTTLNDANGTAVSFDDVVGDWRMETRIMRTLPCVVGGVATECLFVPKFFNSRWCGTTPPETDQTLDWSGCDIPVEQRSQNHFCMVTDELSQVGLALAMHGNADAFRQWVNTIRLLLRGDPRLPVWKVRVHYDGATTTIEPARTEDDDASDATARVMLALFIAASSPSLGDEVRRSYRLLGDEIAYAFRQDFVDKASLPLRFWLAAGRRSALFRATPLNATCGDDFTFAGYYGDVVSALLAAHRGALRDRGTYLTMAQNTVNAYLRAAGYSAGSGFKVPPMAFCWRDDDEIACTERCTTGEGCGGGPAWDEADAVRAISLCKAKYHATVAGVSLPSLLDDYCNDWLDTTGFAGSPTYEYSPRYTFAGTPCGTNGNYDSFALGATMHFAFDRAAFSERLGRAFQYKYEHDDGRFDPSFSNCMGAYQPAFAINNFGSAIGRDRPAFQAPPPATIAATADAKKVGQSWTVQVDWADVGGTYTVQRSLNNSTFETRASNLSGTTTFTDTAAASTVYFYRVLASAGTSNVDVASTFDFGDEPLHGGLATIRAAHYNQLRDAVNAFAAVAGQGSVGSPAIAGQTLVTRQQWVELRNSVNAARAALGLPRIANCQQDLVAHVTKVRSCDVAELRAALR